MSMTDPVADLLTRIRNAVGARHKSVSIPSSRLKAAIAEALKREGFIKDFSVMEDNKQGVLTILLKYGPEGELVINRIDRTSKPGRRVYAKADEIPRVLNGLGVAVLSTNRGVLSDRQAREAARRHLDAGVPSEVLFTTW